MSKNIDRSRKEAEFALAALMEIPSQYKATLELSLLGYQISLHKVFHFVHINIEVYMTNLCAFCFLFLLSSNSRGKGMDRVALPPPQYGPSSFSTPKTSRSNSFRPSAPSTGRQDTVSERVPPASSASDNHVIASFFLCIFQYELLFFLYIIFITGLEKRISC